jgi:hypothetical protein
VGVAGKFYCVYLEQGGDVTVSGLQQSLPFRWFNPKSGSWTEGGKTDGAELKTTAPDNRPWVLFVGERTKEN